MPFTPTSSPYDLIVDVDGTPINLMIDRPGGRPFRIPVRYLPAIEGQESGLAVKQWLWMNGPAGTGWSRETPSSRDGGGSDYGRFAWFRRQGVVQSAGRLHEVTLPAQLAAITTGRWFAGLEWTGADRTQLSNQTFIITTSTRYIVGIDQGSGSADIAADCGSSASTRGIAAFDVAGETRIYVGCAGEDIFEFDGATWVQGEPDTHRGDLATVYWTLGSLLATGGLAGGGGSGGPRLIATDQNGTGFYVCSGDPKVALNWNTLTRVPPSGAPIYRIVASNRVVAFSKPDGLHLVDELGYAPNAAKWFEVAFSPNSGQQACYWEGIWWIAHEQGLVMIPTTGERKDIASFVQFGRNEASASPIFGRPYALCPTPQGLMVGYSNGTDSFIGCLLIEGDRIRWSMAEAVIEDERVQFLQMTSPDGVPRLWIGTSDDTGALHLYYQEQPVTGDPEQDYVHQPAGAMDYATEWSVDLSRWSGDTPCPNTYLDFTVEADYLGDANTLDISLSLDGAAYALEGTATTSPRWTADPATGSTEAVSAQVRLTGHNTAGIPIVVRSFAVAYSPHPEVTKVTSYPVIFGKGVPLRTGKPDPGADPARTLALLEQAHRLGVVRIRDPLGRTTDGMVLSELDEELIEEAVGKDLTVKCNVVIRTNASDPALFDVDVFDGSSFS